MKAFYTLILVLLVGTAYGQSNLPACQGNDIARWSNCLGTSTWPNGDKYVGEFKNGKKHGQGTYSYTNGDKYVGEFKEDQPYGQGTNFLLAENQFKGDKYIGEVKGWKYSGQGTYIWKNGNKYIGEFEENSPNGQGIYTGINGDKYVGEFKRWQKSGQGTFTFADGRFWLGEWAEDKANGRLIQYSANGKIEISGIYKDNVLVTSQFIDPNSFNQITQNKAAITERQNTLPDCQGRDTTKWDNCFGSWIATNGDKYDGEFKDGKRNGQGTYTHSNGNYYVGEFKDYKPNGNGIIFNTDGSIQESGIYSDGKLITSKYINPDIFIRTTRKKSIPTFTDNLPQESDRAKIQVEQDRLQLTEERRRLDEEKRQQERQVIEKKSLESEKQKKLSSYNTKLKDVFTGKVRFDCIITCSFKFGYNRGQLKSYYDSKNWALLGEKIYDLQQQSDLSYYYLAKASEGLGYPEAALIYYNLALHDTNKCKGLLNVCDGFNFPNDINLMVAVIQNSNTPEKKRLQEKPSEVIKQTAAKSISNLSLKVSASDPDLNGIVTISIQTNTDTSSLKINGDELGGKTDGSYVVKRVARVGQETSFVLTATDIYGNTDSKSIAVVRKAVDSKAVFGQLNAANVKQQPARDAVAIIIGIEKYKRVAKADYANADAQDFYDYASRALGIKQENIKLLVDDGADDVEILGAFKNWLPLKVKKQKTDVYVFYSGHGLPSEDGKSLYLMPFSVDKNFIERTAINQQEIIAALQAAQPKSVTMFLDSCYSGQTRSGETLLASARPIAIKASETAYPPNFTVISASAPDQLSSSSPDLKHGIFSYYLMKGMEGDADLNKDGKITVTEMQEYLTDAVGRQAMDMNRKQQPQLFGDPDRVLIGN